jgi:FtsZ-interacting cell division protein ZipA
MVTLFTQQILIGCGVLVLIAVLVVLMLQPWKRRSRRVTIDESKNQEHVIATSADPAGHAPGLPDQPGESAPLPAHHAANSDTHVSTVPPASPASVTASTASTTVPVSDDLYRTLHRPPPSDDADDMQSYARKLRHRPMGPPPARFVPARHDMRRDANPESYVMRSMK